MSRPSLAWPLIILSAFALLLVLLAVGALPKPTVAQSDSCADTYPTPGAERDNCYRTATARASQGGGSYPSPSATATSGGQPAPQPTATLSATATITATSTVRPTNTVGPTSTATATRPPAGSPTPSPTSTLVGLETITCIPGSSVTIVGRASPGMALLVYFNDRPVGGALARSDGSYALSLSIGDERPGLYPVAVRERDSRATVRELACEVPGGTPTPTP